MTRPRWYRPGQPGVCSTAMSSILSNSNRSSFQLTIKIKLRRKHVIADKGWKIIFIVPLTIFSPQFLKYRRKEMEVFNYWNYKQQLEHTWTIWYLDSTRTKNWEDCLMEVGSFSTVEDFWCLFNHIKPVSILKPGCDYSLFKKGVRPMWEDKANQNGGRWVVNLDKRTSQERMDHYWLELALSMIGEGFGDLSGKVNGATVNVRLKGNRIALWTGDMERDQAGTIRMGLKMKEVLGVPPSQAISYQAHSESMSNPGKIMYYV